MMSGYKYRLLADHRLLRAGRAQSMREFWDSTVERVSFPIPTVPDFTFKFVFSGSTVPDLSIAMLNHPANNRLNKPVIGKLFLTPVSDMNGIKSVGSDGNRMATATLLLEASRLAQQQQHLHMQNDKLNERKKFGKEEFKSISEIDDDVEEKQEVFV